MTKAAVPVVAGAFMPSTVRRGGRDPGWLSSCHGDTGGGWFVTCEVVSRLVAGAPQRLNHRSLSVVAVRGRSRPSVETTGAHGPRLRRMPTRPARRVLAAGAPAAQGREMEGDEPTERARVDGVAHDPGPRPADERGTGVRPQTPSSPRRSPASRRTSISPRHGADPNPVLPARRWLHGADQRLAGAVRRAAGDAIGARVVLPDYPLAPEHSWRDSHDAIAGLAARWAAEHGGIVLAGDSSGGGYALALALTLRDRGGPQPTHLRAARAVGRPDDEHAGDGRLRRDRPVAVHRQAAGVRRVVGRLARGPRPRPRSARGWRDLAGLPRR